MSNATQAALLKAEGNALFQKNKFSAAYKKYTQAIKLNSQSAVLYCNRAACSLGLSQYLDAYTDANKATRLDATYAKAWARLGAASAGLGRYGRAIAAWERALAALPVDNLSPAEQRQREQYTSELASAVARQQDEQAPPSAGPSPENVQENDMPWSRAYVMASDLMPKKIWNSSAWIVACARLDWDRGVGMMEQFHNLSSSRLLHQVGRRGAIEQMSNGVLADPRAVVITDPGFLRKFKDQMVFEIASTGGWTTGGAERVMQEAPGRVARLGWNMVRPALSVTVRSWIMEGFLEEHLSNNLLAALEKYTSAAEVLQWGIELWTNIPTDEKGAIFQNSFLRGVMCLAHDTLIKVTVADPAMFPLKDVLSGAEAIILEASHNAPNEPAGKEEYGHHLSFIRYPLAQGYVGRGFYHRHAAKNHSDVQGATSGAGRHLIAAADAYLQAADIYPQDDEKHVFCLHQAVDALLEAGSPAGEIVKLLNRIHDAIPIIKRIWEFSVDAEARDVRLTEDMTLARHLLEKMREGSLAADETISRETLRSTFS